MLTERMQPLKPIVRDAVGLGLRLTGFTKPDARFFYAVTFHRVLPADVQAKYPLSELAVTPEAFRWFLELFTQSYTCGTLAETFRRFKAGDRPTKPLMAVTFDDGQLDNFAHAKPELDRAGVKASFFVPVEAIENNEVLWHDRLGFAAAAFVDRSPAAARTAFRALGVPDGLPTAQTVNLAVEKAKQLDPELRLAWVSDVETAVGGATRPEWDGMMSWDQLRTLVREGHEVGSHSMSHQILTQLDRETLRYEVTESREVLENRLQAPIPSFCYPNGDCDGSTLAAVTAAGYAQAVTTKWGPNADPHHPLTLTRCDIQTQHSLSASGQMSRTRMMWRLSRYFPDPSS